MKRTIHETALGRSAVAIAATLVLSLFAPEAGAAQGVKRVGVQGGFAGLSNEGSFAGFGGGLDFGWSVTDAWMLAATATASSNHVTADGGRSLVLAQSVGVVYALDILQIVPYAGVYVGAYEMRGGGLDLQRRDKNGRAFTYGAQYKWGAQLALGIDWVYSRDLTFGFEARAHALPEDFLSSPDNPTPFYATTFLKAEYTWGWF